MTLPPSSPFPISKRNAHFLAPKSPELSPRPPLPPSVKFPRPSASDPTAFPPFSSVETSSSGSSPQRSPPQSFSPPPQPPHKQQTDLVRGTFDPVQQRNINKQYMTEEIKREGEISPGTTTVTFSVPAIQTESLSTSSTLNDVEKNPTRTLQEHFEMDIQVEDHYERTEVETQPTMDERTEVETQPTIEFKLDEELKEWQKHDNIGNSLKEDLTQLRKDRVDSLDQFLKLGTTTLLLTAAAFLLSLGSQEKVLNCSVKPWIISVAVVYAIHFLAALAILSGKIRGLTRRSHAIEKRKKELIGLLAPYERGNKWLKLKADELRAWRRLKIMSWSGLIFDIILAVSSAAILMVIIIGGCIFLVQSFCKKVPN